MNLLSSVPDPWQIPNLHKQQLEYLQILPALGWTEMPDKERVRCKRDKDYGMEFVEADRVEKTPDAGYFPTQTGGAPGGVPRTMTRQGGESVQGGRQ